jgi:hypothetical protein
MSNFTTLSSLTLTAVGAVSLGLAIMMWVASSRVGEPRLRWVAAGFLVMFTKSVVIILTIHNWGLDHEVVQSLDGAFDLAALLLVASPFFIRRK